MQLDDIVARNPGVEKLINGFQLVLRAMEGNPDYEARKASV
jgi:hypothetical protein